MPGPLLVVDAPSLMYRAFFALPSSIKGADGRPVNALLGMANLILQQVEQRAPRAVVLCWGEEAATYRVEALPEYHADRPPMPDELTPQWEAAPALFAAFGWISLHAEGLEADDLLGSLANVESAAGGSTLLFSGDRDMFQCVTEDVAVLYPGGKDGPAYVDTEEVRRRYGIHPAQVTDFIALRGDPSDGIPGAKGIGEKGAAQMLTEHGTLEALIDLAAAGGEGLKPRAATALREQADDLRSFKDIATLREVAVERPVDATLDREAAAAAAEAKGMNGLAKRLREPAP